MPYTKRIPHYKTPQNLVEYILDEKNNGEKVAETSSLNCNVETAFLEIKRTQKRLGMKGNRVAYHIIQSFAPEDKITPKQANEIGKKLCIELYPKFQCLIATHIDRGHIHNHICINAINLEGKKLEDRLGNEKEGLYGLSNISDKIASQYGCYIMPQRKFSKIKNKNYYYQYKEQTMKDKIKEDVEKLIPKCHSLEELLDELSILGYEIKRGKYISVKIIGMQKFARLSTIDKNYSRGNFYQYFKTQNNIHLSKIYFRENRLNKRILDKAYESRLAIEKSQLSTEGKMYNEYQKTKYYEIKRFYQLKCQLEFLEKYNIKSFDDLEKEIDLRRIKLKSLNIELKKQRNFFEEIIEITEKAQDYIRLYKQYCYAMDYKKLDKDYELPIEVEIFLDIQKKLDIHSIDEAKTIIKNSRAKRIEFNKLKKERIALERELNHLDTIKEEKLSQSNLYIHNIKFRW